MRRAAFKVVFVCITQGVMAWFFYRSRVVAHSVWADSDLVVFGLPFVLGFAISALVLWLSSSPKRWAALFGVAAICALVSSFVGIVVGFNLYGT